MGNFLIKIAVGLLFCFGCYLATILPFHLGDFIKHGKNRLSLEVLTSAFALYNVTIFFVKFKIRKFYRTGADSQPEAWELEA